MPVDMRTRKYISNVTSTVPRHKYSYEAVRKLHGFQRHFNIVLRHGLTERRKLGLANCYGLGQRHGVSNDSHVISKNTFEAFVTALQVTERFVSKLITVEFSIVPNKGAGITSAENWSHPIMLVRHGTPTPRLAQRYGNTVYRVVTVASSIDMPSSLINWTDYDLSILL